MSRDARNARYQCSNRPELIPLTKNKFMQNLAPLLCLQPLGTTNEHQSTRILKTTVVVLHLPSGQTAIIYPAACHTSNKVSLINKNSRAFVSIRGLHPYWDSQAHPNLPSFWLISYTFKQDLTPPLPPGSRWGERLADLLAQHPRVRLDRLGFPDGWQQRAVWQR